MLDPTVYSPVAGGVSPSLQELGMRLHVPYNNDVALIEAIIPYAASIVSLYLPCNHTVLGSGRYEGRSTNRGWDSYDVEVKEIARLLAPHGISVNMLLNSIHVSSDILNNFQGSRLYRYLKEYAESGVEWLTVANIQLAMLLRRHFPSFKLDVSVLGLVDTVARAQYWHELVHPDMFCVDLDCSRDLKLIEQISRATGMPVKVLVLDFCLPDCPYKPWHYIHNALKEDNAFSCWEIRANRPWYYYRGRSVPPYYLHRYAGLIHDIKIVERNSDTSDILRNIRHYVEDSDSKYILPRGGIVQEGDSVPSIMSGFDKLYVTLNSKHPLFMPLQEHLFERTAICDRNCGACRFCYEAWKEEWQVREEYDLLAAYLREVFQDIATLRYYSGLLDSLHAQRHNVVFVATIKSMYAYIEETFQQVLYYFLALAFLELKSPLADSYISKVAPPALAAHLQQIRISLRDRQVICYSDFDESDRDSFLYLQRVITAAMTDRYAAYHLTEYYLRMHEEGTALEAIEKIELDGELLERFTVVAFQNGCYEAVLRLTVNLDHWFPAANPRHSRLNVMRRFSGVMTGTSGAKTSGETPLGPFVWYGQQEAFAFLYLNKLINGIPPARKELDVLADCAYALQVNKDRRLARMVYDFYLTADSANLTVLKRYHQLLLDMNKRKEAETIQRTIDQLYSEHERELGQIEQIENKAVRYAALADAYYRLRDYEHAALYASKLLDIDPKPARFREILRQSACISGNATVLSEYMHLLLPAQGR